MEIQNERMLKLLAEAIFEGKVQTEKEWCARVGLYQTNLTAIRAGLRGFTLGQMVNAVRLHQTTLDWVVGLTDNKMRPGVSSPGEMLIEGARQLGVKIGLTTTG